MREWKFHPAIAWGLGLASGFVVFMTVALPTLFGMLWGEMHPADGKFDGTLLLPFSFGAVSIGGCIWLAAFVARRLTRK